MVMIMFYTFQADVKFNCIRGLLVLGSAHPILSCDQAKLSKENSWPLARAKGNCGGQPSRLSLQKWSRFLVPNHSLRLIPCLRSWLFQAPLQRWHSLQPLRFHFKTHRKCFTNTQPSSQKLWIANCTDKQLTTWYNFVLDKINKIFV